MPGYRWDPRANRYRDADTGRFLPRDQALAFVEQALARTGETANALATMVAEGQIASGDWGERMWQEIKDEHIRQYLSAVGGRAQMTPAMWGANGGILADQMRYFRGFRGEVAAGNLSEAQIAARSRMYINAAREAYERGVQRTAINAGAVEERWVVNAAAEHCGDCLDLAAQGWQPVGTFPVPCSGATQCRSNCKCHLEYRNADGKAVARYSRADGLRLTRRGRLHAAAAR